MFLKSGTYEYIYIVWSRNSRFRPYIESSALGPEFRNYFQRHLKATTHKLQYTHTLRLRLVCEVSQAYLEDLRGLYLVWELSQAYVWDL
jgi:hypothetical protein